MTIRQRVKNSYSDCKSMLGFIESAHSITFHEQWKISAGLNNVRGASNPTIRDCMNFAEEAINLGVAVTSVCPPMPFEGEESCSDGYKGLDRWLMVRNYCRLYERLDKIYGKVITTGWMEAFVQDRWIKPRITPQMADIEKKIKEWENAI